jgi:hypothetical protein
MRKFGTSEEEVAAEERKLYFGDLHNLYSSVPVQLNNGKCIRRII